MKTRILGLYGPSGSGKTTWAGEVVGLLAAQGVRVAVVKTCHHDPDIEPERKDSARHLAAGAEGVLLLSPGKKALMERRSGSGEDEILSFAAASQVDLVLVEGAREGLFPKVAVRAVERPWGLEEPFPLMARVGTPPVDERSEDWTSPAQGVAAISRWLAETRDAAGDTNLVLAGGKGTRLGGLSKASLCRDGVSLAGRASALLDASGGKVLFCAPDPSALESDGWEAVADVPGIGGPVAGVLAGLRARPGDMLVMGVDHVGLSLVTLREIRRVGRREGAAFLTRGGRAVPTVSFLSARHRESVERAVRDGERSLHGVLERLRAVGVEGLSGDAEDVDTPEDLERHRVTAPAE